MSEYFEVKKLIASAGSRIFRIKFLKGNGEVTTRNFQNAAAKSRVKGDTIENAKYFESVQKRAKAHPNLLNLWSIDDNGFRAVDITRIISMRVNGKEYDAKVLK